MKKLVLTMSLMSVASSSNATVTETAAKEFGLAMVDSLVELQLLKAVASLLSVKSIATNQSY